METPQGFIVKETKNSFSRGNISKKYPYTLTFTPHLKHILKYYCNYKTFSFMFKTEKEVLENIKEIEIEIDKKYFKSK